MYSIHNFVTIVLISGYFQSTYATNCGMHQPSILGQLRQSLLCHYDISERPNQDLEAPIVVDVKLTVLSFDFNELGLWSIRRPQLSLFCWMRLVWTDNHLKWDPVEWDHTEKVFVSSKEIWTPDVTLHNSDNGEKFSSAPEVNCEVDHSGEVYCEKAVKFEVLCRSDYKKWPYGYQNCWLFFGSWRSPRKYIDYNDTFKTRIDDVQENYRWKIVETKSRVAVKAFKDQEYATLSVNLRLQRLASHYEVCLQPAALFMTVANLLVFCVDPHRLHKQRFAIIFVSMMAHYILISYLSWYMPNVGDIVPDIILFFRDSMIVAMLAILETILVRGIIKQYLTIPISVENLLLTLHATSPGKIIFVEFMPGAGVEERTLEEAIQSSIEQKNGQVQTLLVKLIDRVALATVFVINSDSASNYVDRVRLRDPSKLSISATPGRGSGWRQKSLSNIDLTTNHKTNGVFRYRDFDSIGICDLYSKNSDCAEYDDLYGVNPKAGSCHNNVLYDHRDEPELYAHETEACSLRRSRSLAIIREETFNDLRIQGARTRRSQLIPRARLVDRSFFKDRYNFIYDGSVSGLDTLTSETQDTESQYSTAKRQQNRSQYPWQQDRSDLESIDSSIFKNSQHQNGIDRPSSIQSSIRTRVDVHNSDTLGVSRELSKSRTNLDAHIKLLEKISLTDDQNHSVPIVVTGAHYSESSDYSIKEEAESGITVIEIKGSNANISKEPSVISYDSIYLSSESSDGKQTVFEDPNCAAHRSTESDLIAISIEVYDDLGNAPSKFEQPDESTIDTLYSQVTKPKIIEVTPKKPAIDPFIRATPRHESQYTSLPSAEIDNILRKSERIDAKLRYSYQENVPLLEEPVPDYDQRPQQALPPIPASGPSSIEESDKGAPSIELIKCSTKDFEDVSLVAKNATNTKIYIEELGLEIDYANSVVGLSDPDSDIASIDPPPSVTLGGKKVIVDEVAAKAIKRSESYQSKLKPVKVKTASAENIYDEVINLEESSRTFRPIEIFKSTYSDTNGKAVFKVCNSKKHEKEKEDKGLDDKKSSDLIDETDDKPITVIKVTTFDRRIGPETRQQLPLHSKANAIKLATFSSLIKDAAEKMPRPQLLQIVDSKPKGSSKDNTNSSTSSGSKEEFLHRVNSVHTYWSKILEEVQNAEERSVSGDTETTDRDNDSSRRTSLESSQNSSSYFTAKTHLSNTDNGNDFQSFCPSVEIVELDGQKKAAIVKAKNFDEVDFDHVRYRVIKSDVFQKRMIINNRKEAQFDGLLQYLQDYSFQELLANNNVVIIEPVRTKIEKPSEKKPLEHSIHCKITGGAGGHKKNALKQNFFYHPIRVNKELLDEELPSPDTVRNVRSMFEHRFGLGAKPQSVDDSKINTRNTDTLRKKALRYLSIDASSFNEARKWDSASMSSGVSSGDLSSPCECNEDGHRREDERHQMYASAENLCHNEGEEEGDEFESHYVSQDILEKIRERGETITYYGGKVTDKKDGKVSAMTKAIMNEINNHQNSVFKRHSKDQEYLGMKFKLIKSNSCSSRLELAGTEKMPPDLEHHNRYHMSPSPEVVAEEDEDEIERENQQEEIKSLEEPQSQESEEVEETVRDIVSKLEHKSSISTTFNNRPRIVEFHPKVKVVNSNNSTSSVTINSQPIEPHAINNNQSQPESHPNTDAQKTPVVPKIDKSDVTVNNHITYTPVVEPSQRLQQRIDEASARASKICRNKDVDLAFTAINPAKPSVVSTIPEKKPLEKAYSIDTYKNNQRQLKPSQHIVDELDTTPTQLRPKRENKCHANNTKNTQNNTHNNEKQYDSLDDDDDDDDDDDTHNSSDEDDNDTLVYQISNSSTSIVSDNTSNKSQNSNNITATTTTETTTKQPKVVSWTTIGKFDEKLYCVNDKTLIEKKKYDEMEFEEFEVFDPVLHASETKGEEEEEAGTKEAN